MSKPELGTKRDCPSCGAKFYDLKKHPVVCPKCKHEFVPDAAPRVKRTVKPAEKPKEKVVKPILADDDEDNVSLDALRDEELAADVDDDLDIDAGPDDDAEDDAFLPDDEDEDDDMTGLIRGGKGDDE
ncbi:MAG: TIGR02300 family protein [Parvibaculum sp.]